MTLVPAVAAAGELQTPAADTRLSDVRVTAQADVTTIHLQTSAPPKYRTEFLDAPPRVVVDLEDTVFAWRSPRTASSTGPVREIRGSQFKKGVARIVVELTRATGYSVKAEGDGLAIVLGGVPGAKPALAALALEAESAGTPARDVRVPGVIVVAQAPRPTTPPPPPPAVTPAPGSTGRLISLDFKDADVVNLLRILAAESGKNIVIADDVKGKMSITLKNVPWEQALDIIMEARGLMKVERGNVIRIVTGEQLAREREAAAKIEESRVKAAEAKTKADVEIRQKAAESAVKEQEAAQRKFAIEQQIEEIRSRGPIREETIRLAYADPEDVARTLIGMLGITPGAALPTVPPPSALPAGMTAIPTIGSTPAAERTPAAPAQAIAPDAAAKGITIQAHKPTNSIFIRHYEKDIERIKKLVRETLDIQLPLIKIEGRVTEMSRNTKLDIGVQWGGAGAMQSGRNMLVSQGVATTPAGVAGTSPALSGPPFTGPASRLPLTALLPVSGLSGLPLGGNLVNLPATGAVGGLNFGIIGTKFNINLALTALEEDNKIRILHRPEIVTTDNTKATIAVGTEIPYLVGSTNSGFSVAFKDASVKLEVTPTVIREPDATKIKLKVNIEDNSKGDEVNAGNGNTIPSINKRTAQTEVVIREGSTLVIGGVTKREETENLTKVPLFGDIPVFGWLFKRRFHNVNPNSELVVFITPTVLKEAPKATGPTTPPAR